MRRVLASLLLLLFPAPLLAGPMVDNIFIIDTSTSMGGDINQVKLRIGDFNSALVNAGIDAHYGLVRFGGFESLIQDVTDFTTFTQAGSPFATLTANQGNPEDGSEAIRVALGASFRPGAFKNLILITDEDDDFANNRPAAITDMMNEQGPLFLNIIGNPNNDSNAWYQQTSVQFGGAFFNILSFRNDPDPFIDNFIATKLEEINSVVPEPASIAVWSVLGLVGLRLRKRRRKVS